MLYIIIYHYIRIRNIDVGTARTVRLRLISKDPFVVGIELTARNTKRSEDYVVQETAGVWKFRPAALKGGTMTMKTFFKNQYSITFEKRVYMMCTDIWYDYDITCNVWLLFFSITKTIRLKNYVWSRRRWKATRRSCRWKLRATVRTRYTGRRWQSDTTTSKWKWTDIRWPNRYKKKYVAFDWNRNEHIIRSAVSYFSFSPRAFPERVSSCTSTNSHNDNYVITCDEPIIILLAYRRNTSTWKKRPSTASNLRTTDSRRRHRQRNCCNTWASAAPGCASGLTRRFSRSNWDASPSKGLSGTRTRWVHTFSRLIFAMIE